MIRATISDIERKERERQRKRERESVRERDWEERWEIFILYFPLDMILLTYIDKILYNIQCLCINNKYICIPESFNTNISTQLFDYTKFKRWFYTQKTVLNYRFQDFRHPKLNSTQIWYDKIPDTHNTNL